MVLSVKRDATDDAFSKAIRESYDYVCASCGINYRSDPGYVHCAHIHTRKHRSTRWNSDYGAVALCAKCHRRYTDYPVEWGAFLRRHMGDSNYEEAKRRAWSAVKYTKQDKLDMRAHYRAETVRIEKLRAEGKTGFIRLVSYD